VTKNERIVRYTAEEIEAMIARGESRSDWAKAAAVTYEEIEAAIASDPDEAGMEVDWSTATAQSPGPDSMLNVPIDRDVLDFFKREGSGYQNKINEVLRTYVERTRARG
jgi:uncharacterized protein (DUF4415 family)